jgi:hypothetical protein
MGQAEASGPPSWAIVGPLYDAAGFLLPPLVAVAVGVVFSLTEQAQPIIEFFGKPVRPTLLFFGALTQAHLVIVLLRSHGNAAVRRRHPYRFFLVPLVLFTAMVTSAHVLVAASVLVTFWDVYHSALQTFGLGRLYDRRQGNESGVGRRLDIGLNLLLYVGPIAAGATLFDHIKSFNEFQQVGETMLTRVPAAVMGWQWLLRWAIVVGGTLFVLFYIASYGRLVRQGYRVSPAKVFLLASTGLCSIYTWGFNSWGQAFLIMNLFHAVQYFALVWWAEGDRFTRRLKLERLRFGRGVAWLVFVGAALVYGFSALAGAGLSWWYALTLVVALMHFWYDGFIWSVSRDHVG